MVIYKIAYRLLHNLKANKEATGYDPLPPPPKMCAPELTDIITEMINSAVCKKQSCAPLKKR